MKKLVYGLPVFVILLTFACNNKKVAIDPPVAEIIKKELTAHDHTRVDNYYWLNERENPKVIDYLNTENAYTDSVLAHTKAFQDTLYNEMVGRIKKDDSSVPFKENGYYFYTRFEKGMEYPLYCRKKKNLDATEEIMLNQNEMAAGYAYHSIGGGFSVSMDNTLLAFGVDTVSRRKYTIYVKDLKSGKLLPDVISITDGAAVWANNGKAFYYTTKDPATLRTNKVFRHKLGTAQSKDELVYEEKDETYSTFIYKTKSKKYLVIGSGSTLSTEYRIADAGTTNPKFKVFQPRIRDLEYDIEHFGNKFLVRTNLDAKNFRLMETPEKATEKENWKELIPHRDDVLLEGLEVFNNFLVLQERKNGLTQLRVINQSDKTEHYIDFGEETYTAYISVNRDFETDFLRYYYTSMTTPPSTFDYQMLTKEKKLLKQQEVIGNFKPENYETKRIYATATDGTKIPVSLVYKKGISLSGNNPLLLYGYGSYGASMDPTFSPTRLSLLDRGFVFAIAHIRGGQEMGRYWYEDGKLLKKMNTFTDFIACAEFLIKEKYTNPDKLFAKGGSAGGLLIGAVINLRPDLFKGVIANVPFVDVVTTMLDETIPLTTSEYDEWGNPGVKEYYDYMLSYSPYDNVEAKKYPNMLVTTGLHDSQVQYFEPAKWVAKLRALKTDNNLLLLKTDMETGHGGASGRFKRYKETALEYAFIFDLLGVKE
jgi:oligopeptidase B